MWQFMSPTASQFGLSVSRTVDERKNPAKATDSALTYLAQLHQRFGSWYLAAAAASRAPHDDFPPGRHAPSDGNGRTSRISVTSR